MSNFPDENGRFGAFGGRFVAETLMPPILALEKAYREAQNDPSFQAEFDHMAEHYIGRPSPLYFAERLTEHAAKDSDNNKGAAKIYLKREDLNHTGAHKVNNVLGQLLLAKRMGKTRIIAETGAGQHGVATATLAARFGMQCIVFMGEVDIQRQKPNVFRMKLLGAEVRSVTSGTATLKDAMNDALRDWVTNVNDTSYCIGTVAGPHPYPEMVRDFQSIIGRETKRQILQAEDRLPDAVIACIGGGSNAMGIFHEFIDDKNVRLIGVEAAGRGVDTKFHAASLNGGSPGILHGNRTYLLQDAHGQINDAHSISAGLDYPGIGPEHSYLHEIGRAEYLSATDDEAVAAFQMCTKLEGIIPALESAHAIPRTIDIARQLGDNGLVIMNLSGRGDKDVNTLADILGVEI
ncbi:MAG: tryptophan synthase subunit beta [Robiginitomaculum sp.]|nr:MAG: tryptophan synthase subunit beta [Robiginitomaculum sp.]